MAVDLEEFQRHRGTWLGFARLMRWTVALIVIVLIGLATFVA
jgi:aa3 type cytochrome c oxidase subunit IV